MYFLFLFRFDEELMSLPPSSPLFSIINNYDETELAETEELESLLLKYTFI